ncbi:MAG: PIG-L family deacetylase, partial [Methanobacteriales archaeon HGW-Methanobacteriales-2]
MKKTKIILLLTIPLILFIALYPIFSMNETNKSTVNGSQNGTV